MAREDTKDVKEEGVPPLRFPQQLIASPLRVFASSRKPFSERADNESGCFERRLPTLRFDPSPPTNRPPSLRINAGLSDEERSSRRPSRRERQMCPRCERQTPGMPS